MDVAPFIHPRQLLPQTISRGSAVLLELLYMALRSPFGVVVSTDNPKLLRQKLYAERKKDPALAAISFSLSNENPTSELWLKHLPTENFDD